MLDDSLGRDPMVRAEETDTEGSPQPACPAGGRGTQEWRTTLYTERLSAVYPPCSCSECFPQGLTDATAIEHVVLSRGHPSTFHRPAGTQSDGGESAGTVVTDGGTPSDPFAGCERVPITEETDLSPGDGVIWDDVQQPLIVHDLSPSTDVLHLKGPDGGDYFLEIRPPGLSNVINPGHGKVSALRRIIASKESDDYDAVKNFCE
jgi:hypothetical protein